MKTLQVFPTSPNPRHIEAAARAISGGDIIIYPTDSLYALGADALSARAIERLCAVKGISPDKQLLSVVCADISQAAEYARIDNRAFSLLRRHLPGPVTFILPAASALPKPFKGRRTVGIRIPANPIARAIAAEVGHPIITSSVEVDPSDPGLSTDAEALARRYSASAALAIDGGEGGLTPTAIVDLTDSASPAVVRGEIDL